MFMVQLLLFADTALQTNKKTKKTKTKNCCRTFMGIKQGAYQHCFRAFDTIFNVKKKKSDVRYVLAVYWILTDFFAGYSGLGP